ncbi:facilitated trehalose transporter Tret1-like [Pectinophora gossypiella]|uniref:facilitated trehalose transporter Tret1-like n=1 Tax=Pectinophora gossypiella TaxID=13191 RepID=UPI00214E7FB1|nr:facilitated trehalose transporter Tret1-like [Pectinophora gossypiella]
MGLSLGAPTVVIPQLRREANSTDAVSDEMVSWLSSIFAYAGIPWVLVIPVVSDRVGRKYPFLVVCICSLLSNIVFYCSSTSTHLLIAEVMQGPLFASQITIAIIIATEYTSPKYRGIFLTLKSASFNWGIWMSNALGTFFHWKSIGIFGIICSIYITATTLFWCESPYWLASKQRFEACARSHRTMKGESKASENELEALIKSYKHQNDDQKSCSKTHLFKKVYNTITMKVFYKPLLISLAVLSLYHFSGKLVYTTYAVDIIKKITLKESTAYIGMLFLDAVSVTGMYVGCVCSKFLKRRTLILAGSITGIIFLFIISLYLYLVKLSVIYENKYVSIALLTIFSLSISCGPMIMSTSVYGELVPLRYRSLAMFITGLHALILLGTTLKTAPYIFKTFKLHGTFLFYATLASIVTYLVYKYLPETKDKTLKEIEDCIMGRTNEESLETKPLKKSVNEHRIIE